MCLTWLSKRGRSKLLSVKRRRDQSQQNLELVDLEMVEQDLDLEMVEKVQEHQDVHVYPRVWEGQDPHLLLDQDQVPHLLLDQDQVQPLLEVDQDQVQPLLEVDQGPSQPLPLEVDQDQVYWNVLPALAAKVPAVVIIAPASTLVHKNATVIPALNAMVINRVVRWTLTVTMMVLLMYAKPWDHPLLPPELR